MCWSSVRSKSRRRRRKLQEQLGQQQQQRRWDSRYLQFLKASRLITLTGFARWGRGGGWGNANGVYGESGHIGGTLRSVEGYTWSRGADPVIPQARLTDTLKTISLGLPGPRLTRTRTRGAAGAIQRSHGDRDRARAWYYPRRARRDAMMIMVTAHDDGTVGTTVTGKSP
eukprot:766427-Hanusia_phi.AAC.6